MSLTLGIHQRQASIFLVRSRGVYPSSQPRFEAGLSNRKACILSLRYHLPSKWVRIIEFSLSRCLSPWQSAWLSATESTGVKGGSYRVPFGGCRAPRADTFSGLRLPLSFVVSVCLQVVLEIPSEDNCPNSYDYSLEISQPCIFTEITWRRRVSITRAVAFRNFHPTYRGAEFDVSPGTRKTRCNVVLKTQ